MPQLPECGAFEWLKKNEDQRQRETRPSPAANSRDLDNDGGAHTHQWNSWNRSRVDICATSPILLHVCLMQ